MLIATCSPSLVVMSQSLKLKLKVGPENHPTFVDEYTASSVETDRVAVKHSSKVTKHILEWRTALSSIREEDRCFEDLTHEVARGVDSDSLLPRMV